MSSSDSVGSLLADIANLIADGRRRLNLADKRHWGPDEEEQLRALDGALDEAQKDFQGLSPLVNGQDNYERDRNYESLKELRDLRKDWGDHISDLRDWTRQGGPIDPTWVRQTKALQKELHLAQCRAAGRIFAAKQEVSGRCLGAYIVQRKQKTRPSGPILDEVADAHQRNIEELQACKEVGIFQRLQEQDIAFVCNYCNGHIVWTDLEQMPTKRAMAPGAGPSMWPATNPNWQSTGMARSDLTEKQVVFAPVAVANHGVPTRGDWQSPLICPFCEDEGDKPLDEDDEEDPWRPVGVFEDLDDLVFHMELEHPTPAAKAAASLTTKCIVM